MTRWAAPVALGPVRGTLQVPGSKSASARSLVIAALADGPSVLRGVLTSRDTSLMRAGLTSLGASFREPEPGQVQVEPIGNVLGGRQIDVGLAGTVLRFLPPIAALGEPATSFVGDPAATQRPVAPLLDALADLGAQLSSHRLPFAISGGAALTGAEVSLDASASSQFISALLLVGARYPQGLRIRHTGATLPSQPHIAMTCTMLAAHQVQVSRPEPWVWEVAPGPIRAHDVSVEPDLTNAATLLAAAMVTAGELTTAWPEDSVQAAEELVGVLAAFGAQVSYHDGDQGRELRISAQRVVGADVDLHAVSELTPVAAALAAVADGPSRLRGVAHIRGHETDRLAALTTELRALGVEASQTADGLQIVPTPRHEGLFHTYGDHRMAHAGALIGLVTPGVILDDVGCTTKTLPDFPGMWQELLGGQQ